MKAITVHGLWAWAIVAGLKRVENRTWPTRYRGGLWIHCGLSRASDAAARQALASAGVECPGLEALETLRGKVIGACELAECAALAEYLRAEPAPDPLAVGPYCFALAMPQAIASPVACTGRQSLWTLPAEAEQACRAQLEGKIFAMQGEAG